MYSLFGEVITFLASFTNTFTFLAGISAVIAAVLPLTTIIFAQYYDKSAERSNELFWEIRENCYDSANLKEVQSMFRKMAYVGANSFIFTNTLRLFKYVSYGLALLWIFTCIGYINNNSTNTPTSTFVLTYSDKVGIIVSTILLCSVLILFPIIISSVRKRVPINVFHNGFPLSKIKDSLDKDNEIRIESLLLNYLSPEIEIGRTSSVLSIIHKQSAPFNGYRVLWALCAKEEQSLFFKVDISKLPNHFDGRIKLKVAKNFENQMTNYKILYNRIHSMLVKQHEQIPLSVFDLLESVNSNDSKVYIKSIDNKTQIVGSIKVTRTPKGTFQFGFNQLLQSSIDGIIVDMLMSKGSSFKFKSLNKDLSFGLHKQTD